MSSHSVFFPVFRPLAARKIATLSAALALLGVGPLGTGRAEPAHGEPRPVPDDASRRPTAASDGLNGAARPLLHNVNPGEAADPPLLDQVIVSATRTPQAPERIPSSAELFTAATLKASPALTLDDALRSVPSFSLFRRNDSLTANPTTQGVSLRGLGPSGASRSLVLLDGVPLNDPFGGWVAWNKVPRDAIGRVEILPGGGATAWGNASLSGVVQVLTVPPVTSATGEGASAFSPPAGTTRFTGLLGDFATRSASFAMALPAGTGVFQIFGEDFTTGGFRLVAAPSRGAIDVPAGSRHQTLTLRLRQPLTPALQITTTARGYAESRGNGTPYQHNQTREQFASVQLGAQPADAFSWTAVGYVQDQRYSSTFSSVNASRTAETPASDQFAVPTTAIGGAWTGAWKQTAGATTSAGVDLRSLNGETRENFSYAAGTYTRLRVAGGAQDDVGVFALREQPLGPDIRATFGVRGDSWSDSHGHRRESDRTTGAVLRQDVDPGRRGRSVSPSAGAVWSHDRSWRIHAAIQRAFRQPTLNELYRPFRQGPNVTEANPALRVEHATSAELGSEWTIFGASRTAAAPDPIRPSFASGAHTLTLGVTAFWNNLRDAVANVTLARGPGSFPLFGTLPAGGVGRQRLNLDELRVQGLQVSAKWQAAGALRLEASYQQDDSKVLRANVAPALVGKRLAEVPRHSAAISATWQAPAAVELTSRVRWIGRQFDDDENTLRLAQAVVIDLGLSRPITRHFELFLMVENAADARVETARTADGVVNTGTPRFTFGGVRGRW